MGTENYNRAIYMAFEYQYKAIHLNSSAYHWLDKPFQKDYDANKLMLSAFLNSKSYSKVVSLVETRASDKSTHELYNIDLSYRRFHNKEYNKYNSFLEIDYTQQYFSIFVFLNFERPTLQANINLSELSQREIEVFNLLSLGMKSKEIAAELNISTYTANTHRRNILNKMNMKSTLQLITTLQNNNNGKS